MKSTLGFDQYRFRQFERVENWLDMVLTTFLYLEWYRARQLARSDQPKDEKNRWQRQRTHGLCLAMRQAVDRADIHCLVEALKTKNGLRRLRRKLDAVVQREYRTTT